MTMTLYTLGAQDIVHRHQEGVQRERLHQHHTTGGSNQPGIGASLISMKGR